MYALNEINTSSLADARKLEFYGTIGEDGMPHITLINSMYRIDDDTIAWGEYCHGYSKINQKLHPRVAFLTLDGEMQVQCGHACYDHSESSGDILDRFNAIPRYRYNTLYGYLPIHFLKLLDLRTLEVADDPGLRLDSRVLAGKVYPGDAPEAVSVLTRRYFDSENGYKVIGWVDRDGVMQLAPLPQCELTPANRLVFAGAEKGELPVIPENADVSVYCVEFGKMYSVMVKGTLHRADMDDKEVGIVDIGAVYNPMMPKNCYIYPKSPMVPIREWQDALYEYNV